MLADIVIAALQPVERSRLPMVGRSARCGAPVPLSLTAALAPTSDCDVVIELYGTARVAYTAPAASDSREKRLVRRVNICLPIRAVAG